MSPRSQTKLVAGTAAALGGMRAATAQTAAHGTEQQPMPITTGINFQSMEAGRGVIDGALVLTASVLQKVFKQGQDAQAGDVSGAAVTPGRHLSPPLAAVDSADLP